jgi:hypothetical protein
MLSNAKEMVCNEDRMRDPVRNQDYAVSEVIGTVLLISLVVLASAIISVAIFSQPQAQKIPSLSALISNQSQKVFIKHVGGDALPNGTYEILVDGTDVTSGIALPALWSIGNTLTYTKPGITPPSIVQVVYTGAGSPAIIAVSYFGTLPAGGKGIYLITASTGAGGSISPAGAVPVLSGANQTFIITNNTGYYLSGIWVDGVSNGMVPSYTFTNVTNSHTILASFAQNPVITASAGTGGTITPNGSVSVTYGGNQTFTIANTTGYYIAGVLVDGNEIGAVTTYTFTNVIATHMINATFAATSVNITASSSSGGIISPTGIIPVPYGSNQTFTITNNTGYYNAGVQVDGVPQGTITNYTFTNVITPHTINATFAQNPVITTSAGTGGTILPSGSVSVDYGGNQGFSISPNTGYSISNVSVDGSSGGPVTTYTFANVTTAHTISANFTINSFNITASASPGGIISPNGTISVTYGSSQAFTITPNVGQNIVGVVVDGVNQGAISTYTFTNITTAHTIAASFILIQNTITASAGTGGTITPSGAVGVYYGTNQSFAITNNTGYYIAGVTVDGSPVGSVTSYNFINVITSHTISATFNQNPVITASAGSGGSISPTGSVSVTYGGSQTFIITPNTGYSVASVIVDGVSQGAITSYTFSNVQTTHTISASFAINTYAITASSGANGAVTPAGVTYINYGGSQTYTITPNTGYSVASVLVDGISQGAITTYTFSTVQTTHTISASFAINTYAITASSGANGAVTPAGVTYINYGGSQTYTITPNTGYYVSTLLVDGSSVTPATSYSFSNVQAPHTISASFAINTYTITASSGANGAVTPAGVTNVNYGGSQTYTITPNTGYSIASVLVDGVSQGAIASYTFSNVQASHTISATFTAIPITAIGPITGTPQVGSVLTAGAITPSGATVTYQWEYSTTSGGTYTAISGATSSTYTLAATYVNDYIKVAATGSGGYTGTVTSAAVGPVTAQPLTAIGAISGTPVVGSVLTAGAITPSGATVTYQWKYSTTSGGTYTAISGATSSTYTVASTYAKDYIEVAATGSGSYSGTVTSAAVGPVTTPITAIGAITGTVQVGSKLTAGSITPSGATVTYQWEYSTSSGGTYTAISGATASTYTLAAAYVNDYIKVAATGSGSYSGTVTSAAVGPVMAQPLTAIGAITGTAAVGDTLTAGALTPSGATATYQWEYSTTSGGTYTAISGATASTYTVASAYNGDYIKVAATGSGGYSGTVTSAATAKIT